MAARMGNNSWPLVALLDRHVRAIDQRLLEAWEHSKDPTARREISLAGLANLLAWLGWLRASELFGLRWCDVTLVSGMKAAEYDLPPGVGALLLRLAPETKSERGHSVDVPIAYQTKSGLKAGVWFERALDAHHGLRNPSDTARIFSNPSGTPWTSHFFRHSFVYPMLATMAVEGDAHLRPYYAQGIDSLASAFYSLHSWRRGARTHVARLRGRHHTRLASPEEIYEHARWRRKRGSEAIDVLYKELPLYDRLAITLLCM